MKIKFEHSIRGFLVGRIWMPPAECYKPLNYNITHEDARFVEGPADLRTHVVRACNDGDFQSCEIADGELVTTATITRGRKVYTRTIRKPLNAFPSIADCIRNDWDGPDYDE